MSDTQVTSPSGEYRLDLEPDEIYERDLNPNRREHPVILYRGRREVARVLTYEPEEDITAVTDDGMFMVGDWGPQNKNLFGLVSVFDGNGNQVLERKFHANLASAALSADGRYVLVQTLVSNHDDGSSLFLFDVPTSKQVWKQETPVSPRRWAFEDGGIAAIFDDLGRFPLSLAGDFEGREAYEAACLTKGRFEHYEPVVRAWLKEGSLDENRIDLAQQNADRLLKAGFTAYEHKASNTKAKVLRIKGELWDAKGILVPAVRCYRSALALDPGVGIKRRLTTLEKELPGDVLEALRKEIPLKEAKTKAPAAKKSSRKTPPGSVRLVAVDLETTGLDATTCEIIEIGAVKFDLEGKTRDTFQRFAKPRGKIPKIVTEKTGITDAMVSGAFPPWSAVEEFAQWAGSDATLVAHNAPFDIKFLIAAFTNAGEPIPSWKVIDTLDWARKDRLDVRNNQLQTLLKFIKKNTSTEHRALADAQGAAHLMLYLASQRKNVGLAVTRRIADIEEAAFTPASDRQLSYLRDLGARESELVGIDRDQASQLIDHYKSKGKRKGQDEGQGCLKPLVLILIGLLVIYFMTC